jgi:hypothetical protein
MKETMDPAPWPVLTEVLLAYELFRLEGAPNGVAFGWTNGRGDEHLVSGTARSSEFDIELSLLIRDTFGNETTPVGRMLSA